MADKYIDRGKDAPSTMLTPRTLELAQAQAEEFRKRAEAAEAREQDWREMNDRWKTRAEKAEAEVARLRDRIRSALDEDSDLLMRTILSSALAKGGGDGG